MSTQNPLPDAGASSPELTVSGSTESENFQALRDLQASATSREVVVPTRPGVDFAWGVTAASADALYGALARLGYRFVVRYISHDTSKCLRPYEITAARKHGIEIVTVFEDAGDRALWGGAAGVQDALFAKAYLRGLHAPNGPSAAPVYFAMDFDMSPEQEPRCRAYIDGTRQIMGFASNGIYGGLAAVESFASLAKYRWQTVAWSAGEWYAEAELRQFAVTGSLLGVTWDVDEAIAKDFGQWKFPGGDGGGATGSGDPSPGTSELMNEESGTVEIQPVSVSAAPVPVAIPNGCKNLHFVSPASAKLEIEFHGHAPVEAAVDWRTGSCFTPVPADVHAARITRHDGGGDVVSLTFWG